MPSSRAASHRSCSSWPVRAPRTRLPPGRHRRRRQRPARYRAPWRPARLGRPHRHRTKRHRDCPRERPKCRSSTPADPSRWFCSGQTPLQPSCALAAVSYTHLDVYKRQGSLSRQLGVAQQRECLRAGRPRRRLVIRLRISAGSGGLTTSVLAIVTSPRTTLPGEPVERNCCVLWDAHRCFAEYVRSGAHTPSPRGSPWLQCPKTSHRKYFLLQAVESDRFSNFLGTCGHY